MSQTVDKVTAPLPLVKAAEQSSDQARRQQQAFDREEEQAHGHPSQLVDPSVFDEEDEEPAVVVDTAPRAVQTQTLGGVAAYQAAARHAMEVLGRSPEPDEADRIDESEVSPWRLSDDDS
ncbi:hypothetical protein [Breoghania sp.]|uniref:hypothetical protein n=1 Tax=Breoghania sp. TaxID=2065378 RepID=UPI0029C9C216|nr:hypothetical protein [Breoghania sp.]